MIPQFWSRLWSRPGAEAWGRHLFAAVALVAAVTQSTPAADEADSPTQSSGPFDAVRDDLGNADDLSEQAAARRRIRLERMNEQQRKAADPVGTLPDPLKGTPQMSPEKTGQEASKVMAKMLKPRSDTWADWYAPLEPLHRCGEPRALPPCVPPPPCHPSMPPVPFDLVGVQGVPSGGPIYEGPCEPRTGTHDSCPRPHIHRLYDRFFDAFYMWK